MKYIWCNIKTFFRYKKLIFLLAIFSVICSCFVIHFSYGLNQNYQLKKRYELTDIREIRLKLQDNFEEIASGELHEDEFYLIALEQQDAYVTVDLLKQFVAEFNQDFEDKLKYIEATSVVEDLPFQHVFSVKDGEIINSSEYQKEVESNAMIESGRFFTDDEYRKGEKVAVSWDYLHWNTQTSPVSFRLAVDEHTLRIQGKDYRIVGYSTIDIDRPTIPITSLDGDTPLTGKIRFRFREPIRQEQYDMVVQKAEEILGNLATVDYALLPKDDKIYLYNTVIMITIFITLVAAINFAVLFRYILASRKQTLMVYRICGMSFFRVVFLYLGECILLTVPAYLVGIFLYENIILKWISGYYEYMNESYSVLVYLALFGVYLLVSLFVLTFMIVYALKSDTELNVQGGVR